MQTTNIADPDFGDLTWDSKALVWRGKAEVIDGTPTELRVNTISYMTQVPPFDDNTWDKTIMPESRRAFTALRRCYPAIRSQFLIDSIRDYPRWNDGDEIDPKEFAQRMTLESVAVFPDGTAEIFFDDGGMFGGHAFILHLDADGVVVREEMFG